MPISDADANHALGTYFSSVSEHWGKSFWLRVLDNDDDMSNTALKEMSLCKLSSLEPDAYDSLLRQLSIKSTKNTQWGPKESIKKDKLHSILGVTVGIGNYDLVQAKPPGSSRQTIYLRLGPKQPGYNNSVNDQVSAGNCTPPRVKESISRALRRVVLGRDCPASHLHVCESGDGNSDSGGGTGDTGDSPCDNTNDEDDNSNNESNGNSEDDTDRFGKGEFPMLRNLGINLDLSNSRNDNRVKDIIGEAFELQYRHSGKHSTNEFRVYKSESTKTAVSLLAHASENAFKEYHRTKPYLQELCQVIDENKRIKDVM